MKTRKIVGVYVAFVDKQGGKTRPVLIVKLTDDTVWLLKITSKYAEKSDYLRQYYYPIFAWKNYGLDKPSYVDTRSVLVADLSSLQIERIRGRFSIKEMEKLKEFIDLIDPANGN